MEQLQENLEEYDKLQQLASEWHSIKCQASSNSYWFTVLLHLEGAKGGICPPPQIWIHMYIDLYVNCK